MMAHGRRPMDGAAAGARAFSTSSSMGQASVIAYSHIYIITMLSILLLIPMLLLVGKDEGFRRRARRDGVIHACPERNSRFRS